ncbi:pectate lyase [Tanacetum coccineum]
MCPHSQTATTSAPTRDIQKRCQKVKTTEAGIRNQDQRRNQVGRRMTCPSHGFRKGTTGGKGGEIYKVTDPSDDDAANPKEGTLRCGVTQNKPLWICL